MKKIIGFISCAAVAALGFSACTAEDLKNDNENVSKTVTVHFGTENTDPSTTKATLTPNEGETAFQAAWVNGDEIAVKYTYVANGLPDTVPGTWDESNLKFTAKIQDRTEGEEVLEMKYQASYPYSEDGYVDFGSARTQTGATYNSMYDLMVAEPVTVTAKPGLDEKGNAIVFPMVRQTAIVYFHFTSDNTEAITKATLKVEGAAIAAETVLLDPTGMDYETGLSEIVLTTTGQTADDFTLWFNVLPTSYTKMSLTVETATKTFTISKASSGLYEKGKLYKVSKAISADKWTDNGGSITPSKKVSVINYANVNTVKALSNGTYTNYESQQTLTVDGLEYNMKSICANTKNSSPDYMMGAKQFIQMQKNTSYICNTSAKVSAIKAYVLKATTSAIAVYEGATSSTVETEITIPTSTEQVFILKDNNDSVAETALDVYEYHINGGFFKLAPTATLWLYRLEVTYSEEPTYSINFAEITGGTLSANTISAEAAEEVTLTATPDVGYKFNEDWVVKDADDAYIAVTDNKFTMPASNVTVSGSFSKIDYAISKTTSERGSFVAMKGETTVETAQIGDEITLVATPNEGYELKSWTVVDSEDNAITVTDNKFTMPASNVTVSATFNSTASYTVSFIVNGNVTTESYKETEKIVFPADPEISGVKFMGWTTSAITGIQAEAPTFVETSSAVMGTKGITYYAVFATQVGDSNTPVQTLAYDTWTYSGSTTNKNSYRLFHTNSYIESSEFELSTLVKVVVYGGTFGGDGYNTLTIGDGTNTWKSVTVSGSSQTGVNTYTDGTPLKGTGKLRITSNSGSASSTGVRISKVEIYAVGYSDYCTNVVTLSSVAVSGTPAKTEYTVDEAFDPTGLTVTGTYSNGESAVISDGISWECTPSTFDASGSKTVSVTATVKSIKSAAYNVDVTVKTITNTLKATDKSIDVNATLDVSTLFTTNSDAEISYTLVDNPSGAGTLSESTFSATAKGTYTVKAAQAETGRYSAAEATATITVNAIKLSAPANLKCSDKTETSLTFTWDAVEKASGYRVSLDGGNNYIDILTEMTAPTYTWNGLESGTYTLYVKAIGNGTAYTDSDAESAKGTIGAEIKTFTIKSESVVSGSGYKSYTTAVDSKEWVITYGGNNKSVGTNNNSRGKCTLSNYKKYAVSPITTSSTASAFTNNTKIDKVSKISYSPVTSGKNHTKTKVYLLYSSDNSTFEMINLTGTHKQGEALTTSGTNQIEYEFNECSGYFAVVFVATNDTGDWRLDNVNLTFTYSE